MRIITHSAFETEAVGRKLAKLVRPEPLILCLLGGLGAGKTVLVRGLARGLGYDGAVTSPTFSIVNAYQNAQGAPLLLHFDMYRLADENALYDIGWYDYLESAAPCAVEWAERVRPAMPARAVYAAIAGSGDGAREITFTGLTVEETEMMQ